jgi:hypothetical protein
VKVRTHRLRWAIHAPPSGDVVDGWPVLVLDPCPFASPSLGDAVGFVKEPPEDAEVAAVTCPWCGDLVEPDPWPFG